MFVIILTLLCAWTESFETQNYFPPNDWIIVNEDALDALWYRADTGGYTGTHSAICDGDTLYSGLAFTNMDYLITPNVLPQGNDTLLSFWYRASNSAGCSLDVLVSTSSPPTPSSFSLVQTHYVTETSWVQQAVSLSSYAGTSIYTAFRIRRVPTGQQFHLDDITLPAIASQPSICNGRLRTKGWPSQKYLQVWGSHYDMGYAYGFLLAEEIMAQFNRFLIGTTALHMFSVSAWENVILPYWRAKFSVPTKYQNEAQGVYDGMVAKGVSFTCPALTREITVEDILCYNATIDFVPYMCASISGWGESTINDDSLQGGLVICRNGDFIAGRYTSVGNTSMIAAYAPSGSDEQKFITYCPAGIIGLNAGVNQEGVGLSPNAGTHWDTAYIAPNSLIPQMFSMRNAVEIIDPDSSGTNDIFDITYSLDHSTFLYTQDLHLYSPCDAFHATPSGILEINNVGDSLRLAVNNDIPPQIYSQYNLAVTNHHRVLYPPIYCWRYQRLADSLNADFHLTTQRAIAIENAVAAEYTPTFGHCTAYQIVFRPNFITEHPDWPCVGVSYARRRVAAHHFPKIWYTWNEFFEGIPGVEEEEIIQIRQKPRITTICSGPLRLPEGKNCRVFDIAGRVVAPDKIRSGIYFIEVEGKISQKVVKVR